MALACLLAADKITIKKVPVTRTDPASGQKMYASYCASCHGRNAKGNGPAAAALKTTPSDLTILAIRNNKFPAERVAGVIRGQIELAAHGTSDMPVWGPLLKSVCAGSNPSGEITLRIANLTKYIAFQASPGL